MRRIKLSFFVELFSGLFYNTVFDSQLWDADSREIQSKRQTVIFCSVNTLQKQVFASISTTVPMRNFEFG